MEQILSQAGYAIEHKTRKDEKKSQGVEIEKFDLCKMGRDYLVSRNIMRPYIHQGLAVQAAKEGKNVCVSTSTSSGKSEIFFLSAMEELAKHPEAKVLVVYPMRALNAQQQQRWGETGLKVGQIDGTVKEPGLRHKLLQECQVVVMTPDVVQAYLLGRVSRAPIVQEFVKKISMVIVDEAHLYNGVFGTNSAYMFRRLNYIRHKLRGDKSFPQYITASATLANPAEHSRLLTGIKAEFVNIGIDQDGSPSAETVTYYVTPTAGSRDLGMLVQSFIPYRVKSISFVESRKETGQHVLEDNEVNGIYPYRAGFEDSTREKIAEVMAEPNANFNGVISTSALEIGIDIAGLNLAIIANMPYDRNSYYQRVGRVGRYGSGKSYVIVVRDDSFRSAKLFDPLDGNFNIDNVLAEYRPTLYLDDKNVQYRQMVCMFGDNEEAEIREWLSTANPTLEGADFFPPSFIKNANHVLCGQYTTTYSDVNRASNPHYRYGLRYFGAQYTIKPVDENQRLPEDESLSTVNLSREAYPGALRFAQRGARTISERIEKIVWDDKIVKASREQRQGRKTRANSRTFLLPNHVESAQYGAFQFGDAIVKNLDLTERVMVYGYKEKGQYDREWEYHAYDPQNRYAHAPISLPNRPIETTGTVIYHEALNRQGVERNIIADILFQAFISLNTFDQHDISHGVGVSRVSVGDTIAAGDRFIALYDASGLNLTQSLVAKSGEALIEMFAYLQANKQVLINDVCPAIRPETSQAIDDMCETFTQNVPKELIAVETIAVAPFASGSHVWYQAHDEDGNALDPIHCIVAGMNESGGYNLLNTTTYQLLTGVEWEDMKPYSPTV